MSLISMLSSMSSMVSQIGPGFKAAGQMAVDAFKNLMTFFNDKLIKPIRDFIDNLSWDSIKDTAIGAFTAISEFVASFFGGIYDSLPDMPAVFTLDFWTGLFGGIGETVSGWAGAVWDLVPDAPAVFTKQYWVDLFTFETPDWGALFSFELPNWLNTTVDFSSVMVLLQASLCPTGLTSLLTSPIGFQPPLTSWQVMGYSLVLVLRTV